MTVLVYEMKNHFSFQPVVINARYMTNDQMYGYGYGTVIVTNSIASIFNVLISFTNQQLMSKGSLLISNLSLSGINNNNINVNNLSELIVEISFGSDFDLTNSSSIINYTKTINTISLLISLNSTTTTLPSSI